MTLGAHQLPTRTQGEAITISWYGQPKTLHVLSSVCLWYTPGQPPLPIRWVLVVDPEGLVRTQGFFTTDLDIAPARVVELFVWRWSEGITPSSGSLLIPLNTVKPRASAFPP